jgi:hypothetical protein
VFQWEGRKSHAHSSQDIVQRWYYGGWCQKRGREGKGVKVLELQTARCGWTVTMIMVSRDRRY